MEGNQENEGGDTGARFSKLAGAAIILAPLFLAGSAAVAAYFMTATWRTGWDGLGQLGFVIWAHVAAYGGSLTAVVSIILALVARRKIIRRAEMLRGLPQVRLALIISLTSLIGIWGAVGSIHAIQLHKGAPLREAEADIRAAFRAVVDYSREKETFPDTLGEVLKPETANRYTYLGKGLPSEYADYRTPGSQVIVVMYSPSPIDGRHVAVCANGMTHVWSPLTLDHALRGSEKRRGSPLNR
jgi:hypothetical protein